MRIDKYLSDCLAITRKESRRLISSGAVSVYGSIVSGAGLHVQGDGVTVDGAPVSAEQVRVIMMDKPAGFLTAAEDSACRTVCDLLPNRFAKFMPIGRLDKDTTGLLLFTSDGGLAHRVISPKYHVEKRYLARIDKPISDKDIESFKSGVALKDFTALPAKLERGEDEYSAYVTVTEGKYHQVKRMFAARGIYVERLRRLSVGDLVLGGMEEGGVRPLTREEEESLYRSVGLRG
ncbi:MAG: rRNA pseudouridine synthase [Oscillospiraceae bacterium]|nr:rRNA pseudouridine synthase [Oscillospiraceae bacterium]